MRERPGGRRGGQASGRLGGDFGCACLCAPRWIREGDCDAPGAGGDPGSRLSVEGPVGAPSPQKAGSFRLALRGVKEFSKGSSHTWEEVYGETEVQAQ